MYFDRVKLFDFQLNVNNISNMYAHRDRNNKKRREKLIDHIDLTYKYMRFICNEKKLDNVFKNFQDKLFADRSSDIILMWRDMVANTVYMHDAGKINPAFQYDKMLNQFYEDNSEGGSEHSLLGAYIYVSYFNSRINSMGFEEKDKFYLKYFMYLNGYIISKHHGYLDDMKYYKFELENFKETYDKEEYYPDLNMKTLGESAIYNSLSSSKIYMNECVQKNNKLNFVIYIYSKLLFSIITAADYYATSEFMNGEKINDLGIIDDGLKRKFGEDVDSYSTFKSIEAYRKNPVKDGKYTSINQLRSEITLESEKTYRDNQGKNIYYLEAPTGGGKTITSVNLAKLMLKSNKNINKLFYIFPFNTLVEQTENELMKIFNNDSMIKENLAVINSITPIKIKDVDEDCSEIIDLNTGKKVDYNKSFINRIFINYPFVITTHVKLFDSFFGTSREEVFPLVNLCNSVIILDEIQSYKNSIWKEIINFLSVYSEILNIKIIIMSATLPRLNKLVDSDVGNFVYLIKDRDHYFKNPFFKDRVKFEMIDLGEDEDEEFENLLKDIEYESKSNDKILLEFIFKKRADRFFDYIKSNKKFPQNCKHEVVIITSDDNKADRNRVIKKAKEKNKKIIIIATQIIEAGVDIDMDIGYKNISILDAEEQFMGRINRSCLNIGRVKFFKIDDCKIIYKRDVRKEEELTLASEEIQELLKEKDFEKYYEKVIAKIEEAKRELNDNGYDAFIKILNDVDFKEIKKHMQLIDDNQDKYTIFLSRKIKDEKNNVIDGNQIWEEYKSLIMDNKMDYAEKKVKLSQVNSRLNYFIYRVKEMPQVYSDMLGDIYYISDGEKYIKDGRFNQEIFIGQTPDEANLFM
ncbi:MAG: CRISPR-associated helicase Cas3' [Clostridium sp.]|uniref:CRISPR-associated helicase Cas3' n=1 Tax=Clostridium sp. TaxID=1506 RepID=UPI0025B8DA22|nr:CRISPR-associated helicase Cas3' [Clostridium sp.]MCH3963143.1 CRISPR-associated helicase Cas3' [Clostridium sp.]MCI1716394.1 CRISPR-associated helicase Cas3' [Clostridium sp.]MCI1800734.1 CRISPR-associated helicase Cas3' [Clostridium sp.]MCI1814611.1 CRISPR-associated helicase Cas3' [Clostridium sp.]MCI1871521.1 CRISPR-associated helicase Cas3' [Clostridium sp.]